MSEDSESIIIPENEVAEGLSKDLYDLVKECIDNFDTLGNNEYPFVGGVLYMAGQMREEIRRKFIEIKRKANIK
jgi:hypothetical protein